MPVNQPRIRHQPFQSRRQPLCGKGNVFTHQPLCPLVKSHYNACNPQQVRIHENIFFHSHLVKRILLQVSTKPCEGFVLHSLTVQLLANRRQALFTRKTSVNRKLIKLNLACDAGNWPTTCGCRSRPRSSRRLKPLHPISAIAAVSASKPTNDRASRK